MPIKQEKRPASGNYSNCPLKKRPIKYEFFEETEQSDNSPINNGKIVLSVPTTAVLQERNVQNPIKPVDFSQPENLSTKPEDLRLKSSNSSPNSPLLPPPLALIAGIRNLSPTNTNTNTNNTPTYLPNYMQKSPLEPITLNPPANPWMSNLNQKISSPSHYLPYQYHQNHNNNININISQNNNYHHHQVPLIPVSVPSSRLFHQNQNSFTPIFHSHSPPHSHSYHHNHIVPQLHHDFYCYPSPPNSISSVHSVGTDSLRSESSSESSESSVSSPNPGVNSPNSSGVTSSTSNSNSNSTNSPPQITPTNVNGSIRYQCPDCSKSYSTFSGLSKHLQFHCASQNKKSFVCKFCEKVYISLGALKMHIRTHTLPCKCTLCGKAFSRPWLLQGHVRTHTGEKPFACDHCHRAFADRSNLRAHLQTHSEVKKYSCKNCSKTFSRMSLLVKHEDSGCNSMSN